MIGVGAAQSIGRRERQEDAADVLLDDAGRPRLLVLSDGMGGAAAGDVAANLIVENVTIAFQASPELHPGRKLRDACEAANESVRHAIAAERSRSGMGGTLVAVAPVDGGLVFLSVGDSLLLRWRKGKLVRVNANHSVGGALDLAASKGLISNEEAAHAAGRNQLTSVIAGASLSTLRIDEPVAPLATCSGDVWILASDGIETLEMDEIAAILRRHVDAQSTADALVAEVDAADALHQDNTTVLTLQC